MNENLKVTLEIATNQQGDLEVNGMSRRVIINNSHHGLNNYELVCGPRIIKRLDEIQLDPKQIDRIFKEIFRCNICLQIFNEPVNIRSCLHKFCKKCIEDYNRRVKKECALCRHPIETRRLMREDNKMKEIINCLIPSIEKFNQAEDNIISKSLSSLCFKDSALKKKQQENLEKIDKENILCSPEPTKPISNDTIPSSNNGLSQSNNNINNLNNSYTSINSFNSEPSLNKKDFLNKKKARKEKKVGISSERVEPVGVRLVCDSLNEDMKKYFVKTKLYTNEEISLDYFSKYICFKMEKDTSDINKISFYVIEDGDKKISLDKNNKLKEIKDNYKVYQDGLVTLHFSMEN